MNYAITLHHGGVTSHKPWIFELQYEESRSDLSVASGRLFENTKLIHQISNNHHAISHNDDFRVMISYLNKIKIRTILIIKVDSLRTHKKFEQSKFRWRVHSLSIRLCTPYFASLLLFFLNLKWGVFLSSWAEDT